MLVVLLSALIGVSVGGPLTGRAINFDCSAAEGAVWWGCGSYGLCQSGQYSQVDCVNGTVYNRAEQRCTEATTAPYPCGNPPPDCGLYIDSPGHRVPDNQPDTFDNRPACSYYFTCSYGRFLGYQACPEGTVYDEEDQRCSEPQVVPPPCGYGPEREEEEEEEAAGQGQGVYTQVQGQGQGQGQGVYSQGQGQGQSLYGQGQGSPVDSYGQGSQYGQGGLLSGGRTNTQYGNSNQQQNGQYRTQNPFTQNSQHGNQGQVSNEVPGPWYRRRYRF